MTRAYNEACENYRHERARTLHAEILGTEEKIRVLRGKPRERHSGLEQLPLSELIERFKAVAIEYDEAGDPPENERLYWELDSVEDELMHRERDQRRALFGLYTDADVRIRAAAADATRTLAPVLSRYRLLFIDDDNWSPPPDGADIVSARLQEFFAKPYRGAPKKAELEKLTIQELVGRFAEISIQQDEAEQHSKIPKYNRLFFQMHAVTDELKRRNGDQRRACRRDNQDAR